MKQGTSGRSLTTRMPAVEAALLRTAATATPATYRHQDVCSGLRHHTFETVQGSPPQASSDFSRPASKAGPLLVRAQLPQMAQPGLRRFSAGDAYGARRQTIRWGAPVRSSAAPPRVGRCQCEHHPVTVCTHPPSLTSCET